MYVNIFQVFCLFSITSGGSDWLCAILLPLWACECLFLYLSVCVCVWLGLISHNKSNWLLIGYIWKKWNAQSLLISHFSHLLKQETSNEWRPKETNKKLMKSSWTGSAESIERVESGERGNVTVRAQLDLILLSLISPVNVIKMCEHSIFMPFLCLHFECP